MARYENGWIKIDRRMVIEDIGDNVYALALWTMLLALANWKESKIMWEGKQRVLPPGSVVFGFREFAERWECSKTTVKKWAQYLHDTDRIVLEVCPRGCIATICNWSKYQTREEEVRPNRDHSATTACPQSVHSVTLNEESKKVRREENTLTREKIETCIQEWKATLEHFKIARAVSPQDEINLSKAAQRFGVEWVLLALKGARKQQKGPKYDPALFVSLSSYLDPSKIERLVNIGAGNEKVSDIDWSQVFGKESA